MTGKTLIFSGTYSVSESCEKTHPEIFVGEEQRMRNFYFYLSGHIKKDGVARPPPVHYIYHHAKICGVRSSGKGRYIPPISTVPLCALCGCNTPCSRKSGCLQCCCILKCKLNWGGKGDGEGGGCPKPLSYNNQYPAVCTCRLYKSRHKKAFINRYNEPIFFSA